MQELPTLHLSEKHHSAHSEYLSPREQPWLLFAFYLSLLHYLTLSQNSNYHFYANDYQIYTSNPLLSPEFQTGTSNILIYIYFECLTGISNSTCQKIKLLILAFLSSQIISPTFQSICSTQTLNLSSSYLKSLEPLGKKRVTLHCKTSLKNNTTPGELPVTNPSTKEHKQLVQGTRHIYNRGLTTLSGLSGRSRAYSCRDLTQGKGMLEGYKVLS